MSPLRIVVIAILLYIAFRMLTGGKKKDETKNSREQEAPREFPVEDVLMECSGCDSLVPRQQAVKLEHEGSTLYFCSQECCNTFIAQEGED